MNHKESDSIVILRTPISCKKDFKACLKAIFGFSYIKLRHLNKVFGTNTRKLLKFCELTDEDVAVIPYYLPDLALFGHDLLKHISVEQDKFFSLKCYKRNRYLLGYPANGQRTHTNARTCKRLRIKY